MALEKDFLLLASTTIAHTPASTSWTGYGAPQYSTATETYPARVEWGSRLVLNAQGREQVSRATVYVMSSSANIGVQDRVVLPSDTNARMIAANPVHDDEGQHHVQLHFA